MAFDWGQYLNLAKFLNGEKVSYWPEAALRSAVSRAYFATYCHARNYASVKLGFVPTRKADDHDLLIQHYFNSGRPEIANALDTLRKWRNQCDYQDRASINIPSTVPFALNRSGKVFADLV